MNRRKNRSCARKRHDPLANGGNWGLKFSIGALVAGVCYAKNNPAPKATQSEPMTKEELLAFLGYVALGLVGLGLLHLVSTVIGTFQTMVLMGFVWSKIAN